MAEFEELELKQFSDGRKPSEDWVVPLDNRLLDPVTSDPPVQCWFSATSIMRNLDMYFRPAGNGGQGNWGFWVSQAFFIKSLLFRAWGPSTGGSRVNCCYRQRRAYFLWGTGRWVSLTLRYYIVLYFKRSPICTWYWAKGRGPCRIAPHSPNLMSPSSGSSPSSAASVTYRVSEYSPRAL